VQGDYTTAQPLYEESLAIQREMGDKVGIALSRFNLGNVALAQGEYAKARALNEDCLNLYREMGDKNGIASSLLLPRGRGIGRGRPRRARALLEESLSLWQDIDDNSKGREPCSAWDWWIWRRASPKRARAFWAPCARGRASCAWNPPA